MFERYNERARRALFYARLEASDIGGREIATEHLLLGLLREGKGRASRLLARADISLSSLRQEVASRVPVRERFPTSVKIPFSVETREILRAAAEQSDLLGHHHIGTEHLLVASSLSRNHSPECCLPNTASTATWCAEKSSSWVAKVTGRPAP